MKPTLQIVFDCTDPHSQARFWAAATGTELEDHHEQVVRMVEDGHTTYEESAVERNGRWAWREAAACHAPDGDWPRLVFQQVPEGKTAKNRLHLDLQVGPENVEAEVERLLGLGATRLWDGQQGPFTWVTLADPEGNELCVA